MLGRWNGWYAGLKSPEPYGDSPTYAMGAEWLADCLLVEDWGCGKGWFSTHVPDYRYRGVDGSGTAFSNIVADLREYRSQVPGIFMRHVLEHNNDWRKILDNAIASAQERLFIALFTPCADETHRIAFAEDPGVPDISFNLGDLLTPIFEGGFSTWSLTLDSPTTQYGIETVIRCRR